MNELIENMRNSNLLDDESFFEPKVDEEPKQEKQISLNEILDIEPEKENLSLFMIQNNNAKYKRENPHLIKQEDDK